MASKDMHHIVDGLTGFNIQLINTLATTTGVIVDTEGWESVQFFALSGTMTAGTLTPKIEQSDDSTFATSEDVPEQYLLGTYADMTYATDENNVVKQIGCVAKKRYLRFEWDSDATANGTVGVIAVLGNARHNPVQGEVEPTG